jgi:hypothetical protein
VTTDHGAVYKNHHLVEVERVIGANILPARVLRPVDKHAVERPFGVIQTCCSSYCLATRESTSATGAPTPRPTRRSRWRK